MSHFFALVFARGLGISLLAAALSWPAARLTHDLLGLGTLPPAGVVMLGLATGMACLGAGLSGAILGLLTSTRRGPWRGLAALVGLFWGTGVALWTVPTYGSMVLETTTRHLASSTGERLADPERLVPPAEGAKHAFEKGRERRNENFRSEPETEERDRESENFTTLGVRSVARLPALLVLGWAIVFAPLLGLLECHLARKL